MRTQLLSKCLISFGVLFYVVVIPVLEWNQTHVFNPDWPPHARFHEVWQLFTHIALGLMALWLAWLRGQIKLAALISCCVMGGVIFSHLLSEHVGGSVQSGNLGSQVLGLELAVFVAILVVALSIIAAFISRGTLAETTD
ncbi:DUF6640 family protein [Alteromonas facilis]|uniref:DUF6640 family protein n=1 Tax=Alteromonas facilis TaxID=2048004 RepID=UPI000C2953BE|nr:DUF6640 family protein [Alteromonas facilis]